MCLPPKVREVCAEYGQHYNSASFAKQFASVWVRLAEHSLPDPVVDRIALNKSKWIGAVKGMVDKVKGLK